MAFNDQFVLEAVAVTGDAAFLAQEGITRFRYLTGTTAYTPGEITIVFLPDTWQDSAGNAGDVGDPRLFVIDGPTIELVSPGDGAQVDIGELNGRNYIDVTFPGAPAGNSIDAGSISDLTPEFELGGDGIGSVTLDGGQAPVNITGNQWRYWINGDFETGDVTLEFVPGSWSFAASGLQTPTVTSVTLTDATHITVEFDNIPDGYTIDADTILDLGPEFTLTHAGGLVVEVDGTLAPERVADSNSYIFRIRGHGYIDVALPVGGKTLEIDTVTDLAPEFTIGPASGGNDFSITLDNSRAPVDLGGNTFRYWVQGNYATGDVSLSFIAGTFGFDDDTFNAAGTAVVGNATTVNTIDGTETVTVDVIDDAWLFVATDDTVYTTGGSGGSQGDLTGTNDRTYIDVRITPSVDITPDDGTDVTITDPLAPGEITLSGDGANGAVIDASENPTLIGGTVYRYYIDGSGGLFTVGDVEMVFAPGAVTDSAANTSREITQGFTVQGPTAAITGPQNGGSVGIASQNDRGFIDVTIGLPAGQTLDLDSVTDLDPEFIIDAPAAVPISTWSWMATRHPFWSASRAAATPSGTGRWAAIPPRCLGDFHCRQLHPGRRQRQHRIHHRHCRREHGQHRLPGRELSAHQRVCAGCGQHPG